MISMQVIGAKAIIDRFEKASREVKGETRKLLLDAGALIERSAKKKVSGPVLKARTGRLRRSIRARAQGTGMDAVAAVGSTVEYAAIHEFGGKTAPRTILPRRAKALRFGVGGRTVFARSVNHPGSRIPEKPYMRPSLEENRAAIERLVGRAFKAIVT
jgi:HK97 gp10 family phage protein